MTLKLGLLGHPLAHSRSPEIHRAFGRQFGQAVQYELFDTHPAALATRLTELAGGTVRGLNVTVPFKETVFHQCQNASERARLAGAANTLVPAADGQWSADNTDGAGFMLDVERFQGFSCANRAVLLLGAGGAVRGVMAPLLAAGPARIHIANRTPEKAARLVADFSGQANAHGVALSSSGYLDCPDLRPELIINGTSASLNGELPPLSAALCRETQLAYDMMYAARPTVFMRWAEASGVSHTADGLGMLVGQAAESFRLWTGQQPDIEPVMTQLREGSSAAGH